MAVQNSLARQDQSMKLSVYLQNDAVKKQINQVVGGKNGTRFISSIVSAVQSTPALQEEYLQRHNPWHHRTEQAYRSNQDYR